MRRLESTAMTAVFSGQTLRIFDAHSTRHASGAMPEADRQAGDLIARTPTETVAGGPAVFETARRRAARTVRRKRDD
jgi:hypothetical protein